jgi:hypothetical protein
LGEGSCCAIKMICSSVKTSVLYGLVKMLITSNPGKVWFVSYHGGFPPDNVAQIPPKSL